MMGYEVTIFFYMTIGVGVAIAIWVRQDANERRLNRFLILTAPLFWPIYVPLLLSNRDANHFESVSRNSKTGPDSLDLQIQQVETELTIALQSLTGWAEDVLAGEHDRIAELRLAWHQQAERIREIDDLLKSTSDDVIVGDPATVETSSDVTHPSRLEESDRKRRDNLLKLRTVRDQLKQDLMNTLAWVRELVTMIHLAKYTGAPASRAEQLVKQIAAAVTSAGVLSNSTMWTGPEDHIVP